MTEMIQDYEIIIEAQDSKGKTIHQERIEEEDIYRAVKDALFYAICTGQVPNDPQVSSSLRVKVIPVFRDKDKIPGPRIGKIELHIDCRDASGRPWSFKKTYGLHSFSSKAREITHTLLSDRVLAYQRSGEERGHERTGQYDRDDDETLHLTFELCAYRKPDLLVAREESGLQGDLEMGSESRIKKKTITAFAIPERPLPMVDRPVSDFGLIFPGARADGPYIVFVHDMVIEEIIDRTINAQGMEQAGFLIGHLCRDPEMRRVYAVVTAQIPAREGVVAERYSFTFFPESFFAVRGILNLRKSNEVILGWYHNHHWCSGCPYNLSGRTVFFSTVDENVQLSAFDLPFHLAIVAGRDLDLDRARPALRMYGWKEGVISERSFERIGTTGEGSFHESNGGHYGND